MTQTPDQILEELNQLIGFVPGPNATLQRDWKAEAAKIPQWRINRDNLSPEERMILAMAAQGDAGTSSPVQPPDGADQRERLLLRNGLCPGDILMLTAAVRDLALAHGQRFRIGVATHHQELWDGNPHVSAVAPGLGVREIQCEYPLIHQSNQRPYHFVHAFIHDLEEKLGVRIPVTDSRGDLYLSDAERSLAPVAGFDVSQHYWIMAAGAAGITKRDFTAKLWSPAFAQAVVDHFRGRLTFVRIGHGGDVRLPLEGVVDLVGKTSLRDSLRLIHHAAGVLTGVSFPMHAAAALPVRAGRTGRRPCVVVAGGREPATWERYEGHRFLENVGSLPCCADGGCWRNKAWKPKGDGDGSVCAALVPQDVELEGSPLVIAKCMAMIQPRHVIEAIEGYYEGGVLRLDEPSPTPPAPPVIDRRAPDGARTSLSLGNAIHATPFTPANRIYEPGFKAGLVIGTYGGVPYVHLQLESLRRHGIEIPVLVHDDGSPDGDRLRDLCQQYGATFSANASRLGHGVGDLSVFLAGLLWAEERNIELLVKFSRRWVVDHNWLEPLRDLALESQAPTFSNFTRAWNFGFRTECIALHVPSWLAGGAAEALRAAVVERRVDGGIVEAAVDQMSHRVPQCAAYTQWQVGRPGVLDEQGVFETRKNYAQWSLLGTDRTRSRPGVLWHNADGSEKYHALAASWGLPYTEEAFANPDRAQPKATTARSRQVFSHAGDTGDIIASLPVVRAMGGGTLVLHPRNTREPMTPAKAESLGRLLRTQTYIDEVRYADGVEGTDLNHFRSHLYKGRNIADYHLSAFGLAHVERDRPWLSVEPRRVAPVVIHRSHRYHNSRFPWARVLEKYGPDLVMVGFPEEHRDFCAGFGEVRYEPTADLLELARVIAGADLFIGNQSCPLWIAEGLKRPIVLERYAPEGNCDFDRPAWLAGHDETVILPNLHDVCRASSRGWGYYSQHGEDRWIAEHLDLPPNGVFAEVGAGNGIHLSNTLSLEQAGWQGVLVEPDPRNLKTIAQNRRARVFACCAGRELGRAQVCLMPEPYHTGIARDGHRKIDVDVRSLSEMLNEAGLRSLDFLSVDTEGTELDVWEGIDLSVHRPRVVIMEWYTEGLPSNKQPIIDRLSRDGYRVVHETQGNLILVNV